eukprot:870611-Rhodomonas_salina.2
MDGNRLGSWHVCRGKRFRTCPSSFCASRTTRYHLCTNLFLASSKNMLPDFHNVQTDVDTRNIRIWLHVTRRPFPPKKSRSESKFDSLWEFRVPPPAPAGRRQRPAGGWPGTPGRVPGHRDCAAALLPVLVTGRGTVVPESVPGYPGYGLQLSVSNFEGGGGHTGSGRGCH